MLTDPYVPEIKRLSGMTIRCPECGSGNIKISSWTDAERYPVITILKGHCYACGHKWVIGSISPVVLKDAVGPLDISASFIDSE